MNTYKNNFYPKKVKWKRATLKKKVKKAIKPVFMMITLPFTLP